MNWPVVTRVMDCHTPELGRSTAVVEFAETWRAAAWGRHLARQRGTVTVDGLNSKHDELTARVAALLHFLTGQPGLVVQVPMLDLAESFVRRSEVTRDAYTSYYSAVEDRRADDADTAMHERAVSSMRKALVADPSLRTNLGRLWAKAVRSNYRTALADVRDDLVAEALSQSDG